MLVVIRVAVVERGGGGRRLEATRHRHLHVLVEANGRIEDTRWRQVDERDATVRLVVDVEGERASVEVEQDADHAVLSDAGLDASRVLAGVHEPAARRVDVHTPRFGALAQHAIGGHVVAGHAERRIGLLIVAVDAHLPVVDAVREARRAEDHSVLEAERARRQIAVGEERVRMRRLGVESEAAQSRRQ